MESDSHDHFVAAFLTDTSVCIGCKACEVACKEWNRLPADGLDWRGLSYDNTAALGASTWRHVKFVEPEGDDDEPRWVFLSDVCKHCANAGCMDACPTGAIVRTGVNSVLVQDDVCNGCGYCVVSCPFGVIDRRGDNLPGQGGAYKCTFCHDRQTAGLTPACAKVCPTEAIVFGNLTDLRRRGEQRVAELSSDPTQAPGLYDGSGTSVGETHALFVLPGDPMTFGIPAAPTVPRDYLGSSWSAAFLAAGSSWVLTTLLFWLMR